MQLRIRNDKMKNLLTSILLLFAFILGGCQEESMITGPEDNAQGTRLGKVTTLTKTQTINGNVGGLIILNGNYENASGRKINIDAKLEIPPNAFFGTKTITISTDSVIAGVHLNPSMVFNKALKLDLTFFNLDLYALGPINNFSYIGNGYTYPVQHEGIEKSYPLGKLKVKKAKIWHFSRYGFSR